MTVAFEAIGGSSGNFNACAPSPPAGTGDGYVAIIFWGNATDTDLVYNSSVWTLLGDAEGGEGSWGADSGTRHISAFWTTQAISGAQTFTNGNGDGATSLTFGYIVRCTKTLTYWETPQIAAAADNVPGSGFSATFNRDPLADVGDTALSAIVVNNDIIANPSVTITWPGTTGTVTPRVSSAVGVGNDARIAIRDRTFSTGPSSGSPSVTSPTDFTGATLLVRLRDTNTAPTAVPIAKAGGDTTAEPYVPGAVTLDGSASSYSPGATFLWEHVSGGTGTVDIDDDSVLEAVATVTPTVRADEDYTFRLTVTDSGGSDTDDKVVTVLRATESRGDGTPVHLTLGG